MVTKTSQPLIGSVTPIPCSLDQSQYYSIRASTGEGIHNRRETSLTTTEFGRSITTLCKPRIRIFIWSFHFLHELRNLTYLQPEDRDLHNAGKVQACTPESDSFLYALIATKKQTIQNDGITIKVRLRHVHIFFELTQWGDHCRGVVVYWIRPTDCDSHSLWFESRRIRCHKNMTIIVIILSYMPLTCIIFFSFYLYQLLIPTYDMLLYTRH